MQALKAFEVQELHPAKQVEQLTDCPAAAN